MYKNILVCVDLSKISTEATKKSLEIAKAFKSKIRICYIINISDILTQSAYSYAMNVDFDSLVIKPLQKEFSKFCAKFKLDEKNRFFIEGVPKEEILDLAKKTKTDLIILGGHGHSRLGMLGSVASVVANKASCNVLIVNK